MGTKIFMASYKTNTELSELFFKPLIDLYSLSEKQYMCKELTDTDYAELGILRCLSKTTTGHEFLQHHGDQGCNTLTPDHFFKALKSKRRLSNLMSLNGLMRPLMSDLRHDPLKQYEVLDDWLLFAGDGHYHKAALFDPLKTSATTGKKAKIATGHFYRLDLRTHHLGYIDLALTNGEKKKEHDLKMIKRCDVDLLRGYAKKGQKVFYLWDRAIIDYPLWMKLKNNNGIYFCTLSKSNSVTYFISNHKVLDHSDPDNEGIQSDQIVSTSEGYRIRKIVYINPEDNEKYEYLTNELTLPACLIISLYKHRWDIEKVFDELKNKMMEKQSWASSRPAKKAHAIFECLAHNLSLLFEDKLHEEGVVDSVEIKKQEGRIKGKKKSKSFLLKMS